MLPTRWVDELFGRLSLRYGAAFMAQYRDLDHAAVKADWADVLDGFERHPAAIKHALDALPADRPPNALQFREACRRAPTPAAPALPAPDIPKDVAEQVLQSVRRTRDAIRANDGMSPAEKCIRNIERIVAARGGRITGAQKAQLEACRRVVGIPSLREDAAQ